jgi:hypothetical protein
MILGRSAWTLMIMALVGCQAAGAQSTPDVELEKYLSEYEREVPAVGLREPAG